MSKKTGTEATFTREALADSKKYRPFADVLMVVLADGREYTMEEADKAIEDFKNKPIKETVNGGI